MRTIEGPSRPPAHPGSGPAPWRLGRRYRWRSEPRWLTGFAGLAGVGACGGIVATVLPTVLTLGISLAGLFVLALVVARRATPGRATGAGLAEEGDAVVERARPAEGIELRAARGLFYLGMLTLGESALRLRVGLTVSEIAFILAFGACVLAVLRGASVSPVPTPMLTAVGIFVFGAAISSLRAQSPPLSAVEVLHAIYVLLLWPWVGATVIRSRGQLLTAFGLWAISGAIDGIAALSQAAGFHLPGAPNLQPGSRYVGFTVNANDLGGVVGIALVPALIFALRGAGGRAPSWLRWLPVPLIAIALVLSGSVASMTGAVLALLVWLSSPAVRSSSRVVVVVIALCGVGTVFAVGQRVTSPLQRVTQVTSPTGSAQARISTTQAAWQSIKRDPIVGKGLDAADTAVVIVLQGFSTPYLIHGLPIAAWYETGLFGLAGLLGLLGALVWVAWRTVTLSASDDDQLLSWGLLAVLAAFFIEVMTAPLVFQGYNWIVPTLLIAWSATLARSTRAVEAGRLGHDQPLRLRSLPVTGHRFDAS